MKKTIFIALASIMFPAFAVAQEERVDTLDNAVVTGTRIAVSRDLLPVPVSVVGRADLERSDANVIFPALEENIPGLFITSRGVTGYGVSGGAAGSISLRGFSASSGRVLVLVDGHPQYMSIYGHPVSDQYLAADAQKVEVSRGASSVLYGSNAMGGTINIITRKMLTDGNRLSAKLLGGSYGTYRGSITDSFRKGKFSGSVGINHDRTDGHRENSSFNSTGGMIKLGYDFSQNWKLNANFNMMHAFSQNPGDVNKPMFDAWSKVTRGTAGISLENEYEKMSGAFNFYYNWGSHIVNDGYAQGGKPQPFLFNSTDYMGGFNFYEGFTLFKGNVLTAGLDGKLYGGNAYRNPETEIYADHKKLNEFAGYVFDQYTIGQFMVNAGVRLEHNSAYGIEFAPQLGFAWSPQEGTNVKLSASKGYRTPNMRELYMYAVANEELLPEEAWSFDLSAARSFFEGKFDAELSVYHTLGSNIIEVSVVDGKRQNRNVGSFANTGVEVALAYKPLRNLTFNANYSFLHMQKIYAGAPEHKFYVGGTWRPGRFSLNLGAMGVNGLYLSTGENAVKSAYVDLKARVSFKCTKWLEIFARGENLLNKKYETMLGFPVQGISGFLGLNFDL